VTGRVEPFFNVHEEATAIGLAACGAEGEEER
jgi:hypothetical protein